jgi:hypothetical protein
MSKKVPIPANLTALKKACQTAFRAKESIKVFYNTEEQLIRAVRDLEPGTTIIASTDDPKGADAGFELSDQNSDSQQPRFDPHAPLLFTHFPPPAPVRSSATPNCVIVGFPSSLVLDQAGLTGVKKKKQKRRRPKVKTIVPWEEEESEEEEQRGRYFFDQSNIPVYDTDTDSEASVSLSRPQRFQKKAKAKTRQENVRGLLGSLFKDTSEFSKLNSAFTGLPEDAQEFLGEADPDESAQRQLWGSATGAFLLKQKFCDRIGEFHLAQEIREYVMASITSHRFVAGDNCTHSFNLGIIGPRKSGKSTLLQLYCEQVSLELAAGGDWKHVFMFILDIKDFMPFVHDFEGFYLMLIGALCEQIAFQRTRIK